jgi:glycerol-3-phosphate dehydrogenase subunit B
VRADVVVIGAGLAGLTAAVRLAEHGRRVLLLAKGAGSTHLSSGTVDVLGYAPERVDSPAEALPGFLAERPDHPYAKVGVDGIAAATTWLSERFGYRGDLERNWLLPTAVGAIKPTALVPASMVAGDMRSDAPVCVVGFRLRDFHPAYCADNLRRQGIPARGVTLEVPLRRADENAVGLANAFGDAEFRATVVRRLADRLEPRERVGFPAALGARDTAAVVGELEERLGHPVFEIPTLPPSVPGIRLHRALERALRAAGGRIAMHTAVTGVTASDGRVVAVRSFSGARETAHPTDWVVLASGGFGSGGVALDSRWRASETVLGLPLSGVPAPDEARFSAEYFSEHPLSRAGVAVDDGLRPLTAEGGARVYENVLVAGATVAGAAAWREKSGDGIALATGHRAAELIGREAGVEVLAA